MAEVVVGERESLESALRRFTKRVQQYEKPSVKRKRKAAAKRRKAARSNSNSMSRR